MTPTASRDVTYNGQPANITGRDPETGKIHIMVRIPKGEKGAPCRGLWVEESEVHE